jgi:hypothetical protein
MLKWSQLVRSGALLLAVVAGSTIVAAPQKAERLAPDGQRGLGETTKLSDLQKLLRSDKPADVEFLKGLYSLENDARIQLSLLRERYRARGWFEWVGSEDLNLLHESYRASAGRELAELGRAGRAGEAYAEMLCDTRFNVRAAILAGFELDARDLRCGLSLLRATADGPATLGPEETRMVVARIDLAASGLRALNKDLLALRPTEVSESEERSPFYLELREIPRVPDRSDREAALKRVLGQLHKTEQSMQTSLFTAFLAPTVKSLRTWRERQILQAEPIRAEALAILPDTAQGRAATGGIEKYSKSERMRFAQNKGMEGLAFDPLDEDLTWVVAHSVDYQWASQYSRTYYDRFLALRGIRSNDDRTYRHKELDAREREALFVLQNPTR